MDARHGPQERRTRERFAAAASADAVAAAADAGPDAKWLVENDCPGPGPEELEVEEGLLLPPVLGPAGGVTWSGFIGAYGYPWAIRGERTIRKRKAASDAVPDAVCEWV